MTHRKRGPVSRKDAEAQRIGGLRGHNTQKKLARAIRTVAGSFLTRRKVRTPQGRVLRNAESWQREGKCNRKDTAREIFPGKGEMVR